MVSMMMMTMCTAYSVQHEAMAEVWVIKMNVTMLRTWWLDFLSFVVFLDEKFLLNPGWICKYLPAQITLPSHCYAEFLHLQIVLRAIFSSVCCSNVLLIAWTLMKDLHLARFKLAAFKGSGRWQIKMSFAFP